MSSAALLLGAAIACSEDEGSTVDRGPRAAAGMTANSGGAGTSGGSGGRSSTAAGTTSGAGAVTTAGGRATGEECQGLPIDVSGDSRAGAPSTDAGGAPSGGASDSGDGGSDLMAPASEADEACNGVSVEAEAAAVDLFVIMDRSQSMGELVKGGSKTRWQALHDAVQSFTQDPAAADIRAGIGFFSFSGAADDALDCDPAAYSEPIVPIQPISTIGPELVAAMDEVSPGGFTPTVPALNGAIQYARSWAQDNPGRATVVVLVTDGFPTQCEQDPDQISRAARAGYESAEHIRTFVIGVGDVAKLNLDNYARAGGTKSAYLTDAGDVAKTFVNALNNITSRALSCEYRLPPAPEGMKLDPKKVQVVYTPAAGSAEEVPSVESLADCSRAPNGGWFYDDARQPSKISVCPCTCSRFQAGRVDVRLGCKPRLGLR